MRGNYEQMTQWVEELKNPIGNLMGQLELHQEEMGVDCYHHLWENCQDLDDNVNRLVRLIHMYAGTVLPCWEFVQLSDSLERALRGKEELGRRKGIMLRSEFLRMDYKIWTDGKMMQDLVEQMLHHVIQYAERGNTIRLGFQIRAEHLMLWVENEGQGFSFVPHLLYSKGGARNSGAGMGTRLELCRCLALLLGGELSEEYAGRGGVRVGLRLPIVRT